MTQPMKFTCPSGKALIGMLVACMACSACSGGGAGAAAPAMPDSAMLDVFDAVVLQSTQDQAPTFPEVAEPRDDSTRRFRAWLGWDWPECQPCPFGQDATCTPQCKAGRPFVCVRPSRTVACKPDEKVSAAVENGTQPVPIAGVYIFDGSWSSTTTADGSPAFKVERITPIRWPLDGGP